VTTDGRPTKQESLHSTGRALAVARVERDALAPRKAAEAAWYPGNELTVEDIEALIITQREQALAAHQARQVKPLAA
jgi:hypothetical protein